MAAIYVTDSGHLEGPRWRHRSSSARGPGRPPNGRASGRTESSRLPQRARAVSPERPRACGSSRARPGGWSRFAIGPGGSRRDHAGSWRSCPGRVPDGIAFATDGSVVIACYRPDVVYRWRREAWGSRCSAIRSGGHRRSRRRPMSLFAGPDRDMIPGAQHRPLACDTLPGRGPSGVAPFCPPGISRLTAELRRGTDDGRVRGPVRPGDTGGALGIGQGIVARLRPGGRGGRRRRPQRAGRRAAGAAELAPQRCRRVIADDRRRVRPRRTPSGWWPRPSPRWDASTCSSTTPASSPSTAYFRIEDTPIEVWDRILGVNLKGTFLMSQVRAARASAARARRRGHQHGQRPGAPVDAQGARLCREQGWRAVAHPEHGARLCARGHPGQCHLPRHHRLRAGPDRGPGRGRRPR